MREIPKYKCRIRSHLVLFFRNECVGKEASYAGKSVMSARFFPSSSIARYLYNLTDYQRKYSSQDVFFLFLEIEKTNFKYQGTLYVDQGGVKKPVELTGDQIRAFNDLLEDIFRLSFIFYVEACVANGISISTAINQFIEKYELLECGFEPETLRALYKREKKKGSKLSRFQTQSSNMVLNYA